MGPLGTDFEAFWDRLEASWDRRSPDAPTQCLSMSFFIFLCLSMSRDALGASQDALGTLPGRSGTMSFYVFLCPGTLSRRSQDAPRKCLSMSFFVFLCPPMSFYVLHAPRRPHTAPRRPGRAQNGAKTTQDGPKRPRTTPRRGQDDSKTTLKPSWSRFSKIPKNLQTLWVF